jgi:ATP-binding cassette subfamily B protein
VSVIQLFVREAEERQRFGGLNARLRRAQFSSTFYDASLYAAVEVIGAVAVALLVWHGGGQVIHGALTFGALVAFLEYLNRFFLPIRDLGAKYTVMQAAMVAAERVFGLLDTEPTVPTTARGDSRPRVTAMTEPAGVAPQDPASAPGHAPAVEFRNVWFAYDGDHFVLRDCSFTVGPGEQVAVVGPTGEGKTTIVRLLSRAYDVSRGRVLVDGRDVRDWDPIALRRHVGVILQEVFLFAGTIEDNLTLGRDGAVTRGEIDRALRAAHAERLVQDLPGGLAAVVRERGGNLSHGQRQLLAITRALLYNPRVLALDEATSSVDPVSEAAIREGLSRLFEGRTSLVIAHRLSTIQRADRILVLHRGQVSETGRHADLLARKGVYARLYELQFGLAGA